MEGKRMWGVEVCMEWIEIKETCVCAVLGGK